jgi:regulator of RNase E activity RraA
MEPHEKLHDMEASGFQVFAGRIAISRAYIHVVGFGGPVEVGGLKIQPGDLIHGDRHGILTIPQELAPQLPAVARVLKEKKQQLIDLSRKPGITHKELSRGIKDLSDFSSDSKGN